MKNGKIDFDFFYTCSFGVFLGGAYWTWVYTHSVLKALVYSFVYAVFCCLVNIGIWFVLKKFFKREPNA